MRPTADFVDEFAGSELEPTRWIDHYLPQWTTPERSKARYEFATDGLCLRIDADQLPWRDEDGAMRVSNIQTGSLSGPAGGVIGQHRHRSDGLVVRTEQPTRRLWTPRSGSVEASLSASPDPHCMLAIWLIGFEDSPQESGEICIAELFGSMIGTEMSTVRLGIKAHNDPTLTTSIDDLVLPIDAKRRHSYGAEWDSTGVRLFVDGAVVAISKQVLDYPLQLMIDLFEFPESTARDSSDYPKTATVHSVHGLSKS